MTTDMMMFTEEELKEELARRAEEKRRKGNVIPSEVSDPDTTMLRKMCREYLEMVRDGEYDNDMIEYISECAIETFFGKDVFKWVNERL